MYKKLPNVKTQIIASKKQASNKTQPRALGNISIPFNKRAADKSLDSTPLQQSRASKSRLGGATSPNLRNQHHQNDPLLLHITLSSIQSNLQVHLHRLQSETLPLSPTNRSSFLFEIQETVKLFSSAFRRTLRSGAAGFSVAAAASVQQKPVKQKNSASLLLRSAERKMHSKVVSECPLSTCLSKPLHVGRLSEETMAITDSHGSYWLRPSSAYSGCLPSQSGTEA